MKARPIKVWRWKDAPGNIKYKSNPDDCDWIAWVPKEILDEMGGYINWLQPGTRFGCCKVIEVYHPNQTGDKLFFGYHA